MKSEIFSRIIPWYEATPSAKHFIYKDKITKLFFAIVQLGERSELQGAGYDVITAYNRLALQAQQRGILIPGLDRFAIYGKLKREVSYNVRG